MRWLVAFLIVAAPLLARDKPKARDWQEGTVQCVRSYPFLTWRPEIVLDVSTVGKGGIRFGYSIVGFGNAFGNAFLRQEPGAIVRFALDGSHVWIKDAEGIEHKSRLRGQYAMHDGDKFICGA